VYYTNDENVQSGLERHYKFGKLFQLAASIDETKKKAEAPEAQADNDGGNAEEKKLKEIAVSCADDAKDYLSEKFGVSRTKIRSIKAIQEAAATFGVVFTGI